MAEKKVRVTIGSELLSRSEELKVQENVNIFYDSIKKAMFLRGKDTNQEFGKNIYFVVTHKMDEKGRIKIPFAIRTAFPEATYLPVEQNGRIYILIIEHEKKSE